MRVRISYRSMTLAAFLLANLIGSAAWAQTSATEPAHPATATAKPADDKTTEDEIAVYFSPHGGCTDAIVKEISLAQKSIHVQAYSFTSTAIAKALVEAHKRGVEIIVILDKSNRSKNYSAGDFVAHAEIPCYIDAQHSIAHNKIMLLDGRTIITGSFNYTKAAESSNAENLLVIHDHAKLYSAYEQNFQHHLGHSEGYAGK